MRLTSDSVENESAGCWNVAEDGVTPHCKALRKMAYPESSRDGMTSESGIAARPDVTRRTRIEAATSRLIAALDALEAAVERRRERDRGEEMLAAQLQAHGKDRSKLAADLDAQVARSRRLEATNREIARRIDIAIETIQSVLDGQDR
jgi:hypothetical protein